MSDTSTTPPDFSKYPRRDRHYILEAWKAIERTRQSINRKKKAGESTTELEEQLKILIQAFEKQEEKNKK